MRNESGEKVLWLVTGMGIGAAVALLFAPKTGRQLRRYLARLAEDSREVINERGMEVIDKSKQALDRGRAVVDEALDFVERGRKTVLRQS